MAPPSVLRRCEYRRVIGRALTPLRNEGSRIRHSLAWHGRDDIDSVAIAPTGIAFAIETKTRTYDARHLARVDEQAAWLASRRRRWCRNGAFPVLCVVRGQREERFEHDVLAVSIDRLSAVLRGAAGMCDPLKSYGETARSEDCGSPARAWPHS